WATGGGGGSTVQHHRHRQSQRRRKPLVDPFLWNPLLEAATLHDRTHSHSPVSISNAGESYLIVTGKGIPYGSKRKKLRERLRQLERQRSSKSLPATTTLQRNEAPLGGDDGGESAAPTPDRKSRDWWESSRSLSEKLIQESKRKKNRARLGSLSSQHSIQAVDGEETNSATSSVTSATSMSRRHHQATIDKTEGGFSVSHIAKWNGMELVMVLGEKDSCLIRIDASGPRTLPVGEADALLSASREEPEYSAASPSTNGGRSDHVVVKKFQILSIENPIGQASSVPHRLLCGYSNVIEPPSMLELYLDTEGVNHDTASSKENGLVLCKSLSHITDRATVALERSSSQFAKIVFSSSSHELVNPDTIWAQHGQGWSLLGWNKEVFFVCWEGSTPAQGAYVQQLATLPPRVNLSLLQMAKFTQVLPLNCHQFRKQPFLTPSTSMQMKEAGNRYDPRISMSAISPLPFSTPYNSHALQSRENDGGFKLDAGVITQAMSDLSNIYAGESIAEKGTNRRQLTRMSHQQKSERLLQHCSSWAQLQDTLGDRVVLNRQEPVLNLRFGPAQHEIRMYSLRQLVVNNGGASPYQQVLAWLAKSGDFFTAASIALDILQDGETLHHLWKSADMIDEQEEESKLDGLLDGITPIRIVDEHSPGTSDTNVHVVHLADMTVGCLIKGGIALARTLESFLRVNECYDPARACLMLAATTARTIGEAGGTNNQNDQSTDDLLWPVQCLLQIGISRDYLATALMLLNVTIPDEMRNRSRDQQATLKSIPEQLTKSLVGMIVDTDPIALDMLLDLADEETGFGYWKSLDHETQLALSLIQIKSSFPIIRNPEIRSWVREELILSFAKEVKLSAMWLQRLAVACLTNSGCELTAFEMDANGTTVLARRSSSSEIGADNGDRMIDRAGRGESLNLDEDDCLGKLRLETIETRNALATSSNGYGIDNDLLIPCLLLLEARKAHWLPIDQESPDKEYASTQALLDAACYLAGRRPESSVILTSTKKEDPGDEKPFLFADFDSKTAMQQCYKTGNITACANLIGGKNGFILHLCEILHVGMGLAIRDVEMFILNEELNTGVIEDCKTELSSFELDDGYRKLLLLLEEHVLSVKTFGEFETVHMRGRVDPVFAARSVFRSWLALSYGDKKSASNWVSQWLRRQLEIGRFAPVTLTAHQNGSTSAQDEQESETTEVPSTSPGSRHRLACAAIVRALVWPPTFDEDPVATSDSATLASVMEMEATFVIEICEACVGLVEAVPPEALKEMKTLA
ncbi:MAG: hypothetical protein SGILL_006441, partial [Bacillariaceae sp.]